MYVQFNRVSDRGGGVPHENVSKVFHYGFTTSNEHDDSCNRGLFGHFVQSRATSTMNGWDYSQLDTIFVIIMVCFRFLHFSYGFGIPMCKALTEYLGGSLTVESMQGIGTDVYIRLRHIDGRRESFRIWRHVPLLRHSSSETVETPAEDTCFVLSFVVFRQATTLEVLFFLEVSLFNAALFCLSILHVTHSYPLSCRLLF